MTCRAASPSPVQFSIDLPLNDELSPETLRDARLVVCGAARDATEAQEVLWALGLAPDPEHKPSWSSQAGGLAAKRRLQRGN